VLCVENRAGESHLMVFRRWFAWYPVWPEDERGIFWLDPVWVR
jgi:hypothetical protein